MRYAWWTLVVLLAVPMLVQAQATSAEGSTMRWSGEVVLDGSYHVARGETLVISPGTTIRAADGHEGAYLHVEGQLVAAGEPDAPIRFYVAVNLDGPGADASLIRHAAFDHASYRNAHSRPGGCALGARDADYRVESSRFSNNTWTVCHDGGHATFRNNTFLYNAYGADDTGGEPSGDVGEPGACWRTWRNDTICRPISGAWFGAAHGALWVADGRATVVGNLFEANLAGLHIWRNADAVVRGNTFRDNAAGVVLQAYPARDGEARTVVLDGNRFTHHGLWREDLLPPAPAAFVVEGRLGTGAWPTRPGDTFAVANSTFERNGLAILLEHNARGIRFENLTITDNEIGIRARYGQAMIQDSTLENRRLDLQMWGKDADIRLQNTTFEPGKVYLDPGSTVGWEGGVLRFIPLLVAFTSLLAVVVAAVTEAGQWLLMKGFLAAGYSRIQRSKLLEHPKRQMLLDRIRDDPGAHLRELARDVGGYGTAVYHLTRLEQEGYVRSARDGTLRRFYPVGEGPTDRELAPVARELAELVEREAPIGIIEASRALGHSKQLISYHANRLAEAGVVRIEAGDGGSKRLLPASQRAEQRQG